MKGIVEFLFARYDEDEKRARLCTEWSECGRDDWESDGETYGCPGHSSMTRSLADLAAKRQIVNDAGFAMLQAEINPRQEGNYAIHAAALLARHVLLNLAQVYLGHPRYDASWAL